MSGPKVGTPSLRELAGIRKKFLQLGREIEQMPGGPTRANLIHSKDKLGGFLSDAFGWKAWRYFDEDNVAARNVAPRKRRLFHRDEVVFEVEAPDREPSP